MTLTQILQKIRNTFYTKKEIDSMGGGTSLSDTISHKANDSDVVHKTGNETVYGVKDFGNQINTHQLGGLTNSLELYGGNNLHDGIWIQLSKYGTTNVGNSGLRIRQTLNKEIDEYYEIRYEDGSFYPLSSASGGRQTLGRSDIKWADVNTVLLNGKTPDTIEEQGDDYIRYSNGLQICWGLVSEGMTVTTNFPKSFSQTPSISITSNTQNTDSTPTANCTKQVLTVYNKFGYYSSFYTAIGRWK